MTRKSKQFSQKKENKTALVPDVLGQSGEKSTLGVRERDSFKILTEKEKTSREQFEKCQIHDQPIVAFEEETNETLCEKCVFEGKGDRPVFTASVAKKLQNKFKDQFGIFEERCDTLEKLNQSQIKQIMQEKVEKLFTTFRQKIDDLEAKVTTKISDSTNLNQLITNLERMHDYMEANAITEKYDRENDHIQRMIEQTRFTYVSQRREHFGQVIDDMTADNKKLQDCIDECNKNIRSILTVEQDDNKITKELNKLVSQMVLIDNQHPDFGNMATPEHEAQPMSPFAKEIAEEMKGQDPPELESHPIDNLRNFYYTEEDKLMCKSITKSGRVNAAKTVGELSHYFSKIVTVPQEKGHERVFILGGSTDEEGNDVVGTCQEVEFKGRGKIGFKDIASMPNPRVAFGACVSQDGTKIYIVGGTSGENKTPSELCEVYDIDADTWTQIDSINQPRFSATIIENQGDLFCIGGLHSDHKGNHHALESIEWINLTGANPVWEQVRCKVPYKACSVGALSLQKREVLIFGGWANNQYKDNACVLREYSNGEFEITPSDPLQDKDSFLVNGVRCRNDKDREIVFFGQQHTHSYNEIERKFMSL